MTKLNGLHYKYVAHGINIYVAGFRTVKNAKLL